MGTKKIAFCPTTVIRAAARVAFSVGALGAVLVFDAPGRAHQTETESHKSILQLISQSADTLVLTIMIH